MNWLISCCRRCCSCCSPTSAPSSVQPLTIIPDAGPRSSRVDELASCRILQFPTDDAKFDLPTAKKLIASIPTKVAISPSSITQTRQVYYLNQELKNDAKSAAMKEIVEGLNFALEKNKKLANLSALVFDRSLTARAVSKPACELFDCGPQDLLGHSILDLFQSQEKSEKTIVERIAEIETRLKSQVSGFIADSIELKKTKKEQGKIEENKSEGTKELALHHYTLRHHSYYISIIEKVAQRDLEAGKSFLRELEFLFWARASSQEINTSRAVSYYLPEANDPARKYHFRKLLIAMNLPCFDQQMDALVLCNVNHEILAVNKAALTLLQTDAASSLLLSLKYFMPESFEDILEGKKQKKVLNQAMIEGALGLKIKVNVSILDKEKFYFLYVLQRQTFLELPEPARPKKQDDLYEEEIQKIDDDQVRRLSIGLHRKHSFSVSNMVAPYRDDDKKDLSPNPARSSQDDKKASFSNRSSTESLPSRKGSFEASLPASNRSSKEREGILELVIEKPDEKKQSK